PLVEIQKRPGSADYKKILDSLVFEIGEKRAGSVVENAEAGLFRYVLECSVTAIAIEPVRQAGGLADIEIVEAVIVEVAHRDTVVAVDVDADGAVQHGAPVIRPMEQLPVVGIGIAQRMRRDI